MEQTTTLTADVMQCLVEILELARDSMIPPEDRLMRLDQYAVCAAGGYSPEAAFDPTARQLRELAARGTTMLADCIESVRTLVRRAM